MINKEKLLPSPHSSVGNYYWPTSKKERKSALLQSVFMMVQLGANQSFSLPPLLFRYRPNESPGKLQGLVAASLMQALGVMRHVGWECWF